MKVRITWTSIIRASRTLSLSIVGPKAGAPALLGVRDGDGVGGGKGWSNGAPYGRCTVKDGCGAMIGTDMEAGDAEIAEEEALGA